MAEKHSDKKLFIAIGALFLFLAIAYSISLGPLSSKTSEVEMAKENVEEIEDAYGENPSNPVNEADVRDQDPGFDFGLAKRERILGDRSAPIKLVEHSSFSCGHCGKFHNETFKTFKTEYIDTGKAYLVFSDFPLNQPALHATMAGRCIENDDAYFEYVAQLFAEQEDWAYEANYLSYLENTAAKYGVDSKTFQACIQSVELREAIVKRIQAVQSQWEVRSTPSFVINNQKVIIGVLSYEKFDKTIQDALADIKASAAQERGVDAP